ncbi:MAG: 4-hydroxyphenylpyruvate dioxygenase [Candidatus Polarisedimenticolia bacterium]
MFKRIDHIEYCVGNAFVTAYFFTHALGFRSLAQAGLETGLRDRQSFVVQQGDIRLVFTNALAPGGPVAEHVRNHGDSIRDVALQVDDAARAFDRCLAAGAEPIEEPTLLSGASGPVRRAAVRTFGDTIHSLVERRQSSDEFLPGFRPWDLFRPPRPGGLTAVDHVACCVEQGALGDWMDFYERAFGFREMHHEDIVTERSAMNSKVVQSDNGAVKLPLMEPAHGHGKSQIDEYLDYHKGAGAQHLALLSSDIATTVRTLRAGGLQALQTPDMYYDGLRERVGEIEENVAELKDLGVLVDRDAWGYLLQVFTKPVTGRPTGFLEVVQRKGARGFGGGNVRALFEAVEREQAARGNL